VHHFEGKPLVQEFIANTLMGIEYRWDGPVQLETSEVVSALPSRILDVFSGQIVPAQADSQEAEVQWQRVLYTMKDRKLSKTTI